MKKVCEVELLSTVKSSAKANNKYIRDQYNLYHCGMIQKIPTYGFALENVDRFTTEKIDKSVKNDKKGYILEVNVEYPK